MKTLLIAGLVLLSGTAYATAQGTDRLPKEMLGVWSTNLEACPDQASEAKMTVTPKEIQYYEVMQTVRKVAKQKDGWLRVSGQSIDLDGKGPSTIDIKVEGDKITIGKADGQSYFRCPKDGPK